MKRYLNNDFSCFIYAMLVVLILLVSSCSSNWKLAYLKTNEPREIDAFAADAQASGGNAIEIEEEEKKVDELNESLIDTTYKADDLDAKIEVDADGNIIGEFKDGIKLQEIVITESKSKNTPVDTSGRLNMSMTIEIPKDIMSGGWQMRLHPRIYIRQNKIETFNFPIEDLYITGSEYRDKQIMGYEKYSNYLGKISSEDFTYDNDIDVDKVLDEKVSRYVNKYQLEYMLKRNFPELRSKNIDSLDISDEKFAAVLGIDKQEFIEHYYNKSIEAKIARLSLNKNSNFKEWVYNPIVSDNVQADNLLLTDTLKDFDKVYTAVLKKIKESDTLSKLYYTYLDSVKKNPKLDYPDLRSDYFKYLDSVNYANRDAKEKEAKGKVKKFSFDNLKADKFKLDKAEVISGSDTSKIYMKFNYSTTLNAYQYPNIDRVYIGFTGDVYDDTTHIHNFTMRDRLSYPVTSIANLADTTEIFYDYEMLLRKANHGASYSIEFQKNSAALRDDFRNNSKIIADIKANLDALMKNAEFNLDSIIVSATASPEGAINVNQRFSGQRSQAVSSYFRSYVDSHQWRYKARQDSIRRESQESIASAQASYNEGLLQKDELDDIIKMFEKEIEAAKPPKIEFKDYPIAENWDDLNLLVSNDSIMTDKEKDLFFETYDKYSNLDVRENTMKKHSYYNYMSKELYPKIRVVKFDFHMHRKGMEHDTIWIPVPSKIYMEGVKALRGFDFVKAENILKNYPSYNAAICFLVRLKPLQAINILEDSRLKIDFEKFKKMRDEYTIQYVNTDTSMVEVRDSLLKQIQVVKDTMDRAAKIEFLKAKAYVMKRKDESDWHKALDSYFFILKMDQLNGVYNVALTGEADIRGAVFGSSKYFEYTALTDEYLQSLPRVSIKGENFGDLIEKYKEKISLEMAKEKVKYFNEEQLANFKELKEYYEQIMGYTGEVLEKALYLGIEPEQTNEF